ncbi:methyltransferase TARBP1 [Chlorella sorokiniana]|uniref:Methyltransferase TARBP1 n=1 Tax=Chlorella sorokiniana TaxID=3076 RepID=A0A2P6TGA6_CHLSO|nr:methyltransferase TARBP1 [Chlorella sorokiniana]|eukprot:PRW33151.1 methyltransferase TARBP1 [Chlorella sorokiniana]
MAETGPAHDDDLADACSRAPKFGLNAKALILQAALAEDDEPAAPRPDPAAEAAAATARRGAEYLTAVDVKQRPLVAYLARSKIPRINRQTVLNKLAGEHLALAGAATCSPALEPAAAAANLQLRKAAFDAALAQELELFRRCGSAQVYQNLAARTSATQWPRPGGIDAQQAQQAQEAQQAQAAGQRGEAPNAPLAAAAAVRQQVELFVRAELHPLLKRQQISLALHDAVCERCTAKIMACHADATSADFLVPEAGSIRALQPDGQLPPAWQPLLKLLDCLEELSPHLVKDAWGEIDRLHPPTGGPEGSGSEGSSEGSLEWKWMEVVWSRGLAHEHQQVQRMVLSSFMSRRWEPAQLSAVPAGFVLHTLLPAAGQGHLWRGEGAAELQQALFGTSVAQGRSAAAAAAAAAAALHGPAGSLQQLLGRLLDLGAKSWRTMAIVSLQLCGLLVRHPELAGHYSAPVQTLLLWGAADDPGQSGVGDPVDAEAAAELAALMAPGDAQLAAAFASSPLAPRVAALCLLHSWAEQAQQAQQAAGQQQAAPAAAAAEAGRQFWRQLFDLALHDGELGATRYSSLGVAHRRKVRLWQALCVLSPLVPPHEAEEVLGALLSLMAATADAANVRQYQDTIALVLLRQRSDLLRSRVLPPLADCSSSGSHALSSLILIAARAAVAQLAPAGQPVGGGIGQAAACAATEQQGQQQQQLTEEQRGLLADVVAAVAPWALCHVHALRTFAQLVLWRLFELFPSLPAGDATAAALLRFFRENDDVNRLRRGLAHAFYFDAYQLDAAVTPAGVLGQEGSAQRGEEGFEGAPQPLLEVVQSFLAIERQALRHDMRQREAATAAAELAPTIQQQQQQQQLGHQSGGGSNWQKKGGGAAVAGPAAAGPWADALGASALLAAAGGGSGLDGTELELGAAEEAAAAARGGPRQELVVVASLLTKAPNLAGLARTCEVFRASSLVLGDLAVTRQKEFTSIAVTAHHWVPLQEVPEAALAPWLRRQAADGWALVGLEQTAESVPLQDFGFPSRAVLVLGREKEGIPADILALLHHTVEIPQLGLIRSLNVHVSGAIGMYEYTRQALQAAQGSAAAQQAGSG